MNCAEWISKCSKTNEIALQDFLRHIECFLNNNYNRNKQKERLLKIERLINKTI